MQRIDAMLELHTWTTPNGKKPAIIVDEELGRVVVFESGAILQYLAEKYGRFLPRSLGFRRAEVLSWLSWQGGGPGPLFGQLHHFMREENRNEAAYRHFETEARRLIGVLNLGLDNREYVAEEYSIADIAIYPWFEAITHDHARLFDHAKNVREWLHRVGKRPAVKRGMTLDGAKQRAA